MHKKLYLPLKSSSFWIQTKVNHMATHFFKPGIHQCCKHGLQTPRHLLAVFLDHQVGAEWVSVIRQPCPMQCALGD